MTHYDSEASLLRMKRHMLHGRTCANIFVLTLGCAVLVGCNSSSVSVPPSDDELPESLQFRINNLEKDVFRLQLENYRDLALRGLSLVSSGDEEACKSAIEGWMNTHFKRLSEFRDRSVEHGYHDEADIDASVNSFLMTLNRRCKSNLIWQPPYH